jgi:hypothetical protein
MSINILIDTCCWKEIVSKIDVSKRLKLLKRWQDFGHIQLFCPEVLQKEWEKHRELEKKNIKSAVSNYSRSIRALDLFDLDVDVITPNQTLAERKLLYQIELIDELLKNALQLEVTAHATHLSYQHKKDNLAPFRQKKDSDNDAYLIFSTLDYLKENSEENIIFISSNHTDFASPKDNDLIHPDISDKYPGLNIMYFSKIENAFNHIKDLGLLGLDETPKYYPSVPKEIKIKRKVTIIDQTHQYLTSRFAELKFLPKDLWAVHYPFIVSDQEGMSQQSYVLNTDNDDVREFLLGIKIENNEIIHLDNESYNNTNDVLIKVKEILKCLHFNLITNIGHQKPDVPHYGIYKEKMPLIEDSDCNCYLCLYRKFKFTEIISDFKTQQSEIDNRFKIAYTLYKIGRYVESGNLFIELAKETLGSQQFTLHFIAKFNLKQIFYLIRYNSKDDQETQKLIAAIHQIDLEEEFSTCKKTDNKRILEWIKSLSFIKETKDNILKKVNKIRDSYYSESTGFNEYTQSIIHSFLELTSFLNFNQIAYDKFSDFQEITDLFIEGLLASYACQNGLRGKLNHFTDWTINMIIQYGKSEKIRDLIYRYKIKKIAYHEAEDQEGFHEEFIRLLKSYSSLNDEFKENAYFQRKVNSFIMNAITIASLIDTTQEKINDIAIEILNFTQLEEIKVRQFEFNNILSYFFLKKGEVINIEILKKYFRILVLDIRFNDEVVLYRIARILKNKKEIIVFDEKEFSLIRSFYLEKLDDANESKKHLGLVTTLFDIVANESYKNAIKNKIENGLKSKFDAHIFYYSAINDIIPFNERLVSLYTDYISQIVEKGKRKHSLDYDVFYSDRKIDEYINMMFKYSYQFPQPLAQKIQELDEYYKWVLNIGNYDYNKFNPAWLRNHFTRYYRSAFRKSSALKEHLISLHFKERNDELSSTFIDIYYHS